MNKFRRSVNMMLSLGMLLSLSVGASAAPSNTFTPASEISNVNVSAQQATSEVVVPITGDNLNQDISPIRSKDKPVVTVEQKTTTNAVKVNKDEVTIYGTSAPTSYYNIGVNGAYTGSFWTNRIYTNYYFTANSSKKLYLDLTTTTEDWPTTTKSFVYLYRTDSSGYLTKTELSAPGSSTVTFSNLDPNKFYYIAFGVEALNKGFNGSIKVYH